MFDELKLLSGEDYKINDTITVYHPTLRKICNYGEQQYYRVSHALTCNPSAYKVNLFDMGIDYETISDFDFFCLICGSLTKSDTNVLLGDLQLSDLVKKDDALYNKDGKIVIDISIYNIMVQYIRKINGIKKIVEKSGNKGSKQYLIEKDRRRLQYERSKCKTSVLVPLISAMVNCEHFKYDHNSVWNLPIYVFNDSVSRIQKGINYNQIMTGVYTGNIDIKNVNQNEINWLS